MVSGGLTIATGGAFITGGITVNTGGLYVTNGVTVLDAGLSATGGLTVNNNGVNIVSGGLNVNDYGVYVSGGVTINTVGLNILAGGLTVFGATNLETTPYIISLSDRRLKRNIQTVMDPLVKVSKLRGVYFNWAPDHVKGDDNRHVGMIAQDILNVLPEAIRQMDGTQYLGIDYNEVIPLLVEAVRELTARTEQIQDIMKEQEKQQPSQPGPTADNSTDCSFQGQQILQLQARIQELENENAALKSTLQASS
jgi:hypothetical protein